MQKRSSPEILHSGDMVTGEFVLLLLQGLADGLLGFSRNPFVAIYKKDPMTLDGEVIESPVSLVRVVSEGVYGYVGCVLAGDLQGSIATLRVQHPDLVTPRETFQALPDVPLLIVSEYNGCY